MGINIRPHIISALEQIKKDYNMIIYTASHQTYADKVVDLIDPMKSFFKYRLYRHNCVEVPRPDMPNSTLYVKDLRIIKNIPLENMVIIDNSVLSFAFHLDNGIPILPFYSNKEDIEMNSLKDYLQKLAKLDNLTINNAAALNLRDLLEEAVKQAEQEDCEEVESNNSNSTTDNTSKSNTTTSTPMLSKKETNVNGSNSNVNINNGNSSTGKLESKKINKVVSSNGNVSKNNNDNKKISNVKNGGSVVSTTTTTNKEKKITNTNKDNKDSDNKEEKDEKTLKAPTRRKSNIGTMIKQTMNYKK